MDRLATFIVIIALTACVDGERGPMGDPGPQGVQGPAGPEGNTNLSVIDCPQQKEHASLVSRFEPGGSVLCVYNYKEKDSAGQYVRAPMMWSDAVFACQTRGYQGLCSIQQLTIACKKGYDMTQIDGAWTSEVPDADLALEVNGTTDCGNLDKSPAVLRDDETTKDRGFVCCSDYPVYP